MRNKNMSYQQEKFFNIMSSVGCMSYVQAQMLLQKYLHCSENSAKYIIHDGMKQRFIEIIGEEAYVTNGSRAYNNASEVNMNIVRAMYYFLDNIKVQIDRMNKEEDTEQKGVFKDEIDSEMRSLYSAYGADSVLNDVLDKRLYESVPASVSAPYKVNLAVQRYKDAEKRLNKKNILELGSYITVFLFPETEDADEVLEMMEGLGIDIPHIIVCFHSGSPTKWMTYDAYAGNIPD